MSVKDNIDRETKAAKEKIDEAAETVRDSAEHAGADVKNAAHAYAEEGKKYAASHISTFASAVRRASDELSERDQGIAARVVTEAADGLEQVANSISNKSVDEMVVSVERFARRNPSAFVIGTVLAGVALGRFAKSSSDRAASEREEPEDTMRNRPTVGPSNPTSL
ncbi:hypothetical protein L1787_06785 [Acuticoccus sp. M5D2P5]|uniref:hypothetical protein n=1 Tax=Acuticoccus kalidii TaxID=2910977 RepID=UPI001F448613|nr:hypothetical protein [Acuticoccus kalidii]MCF3933120.1 hypothetical protein [Acuticoccus kalidii]